ncbi:hypothetical protein [Nitrobacter vulgaris]|uniref:Uncharacterized protein n=1 Tax=Nitrobacter vulgaris TaxID=29421 RepID=A0A1V4HX74_NITVU|nr:hypothetical protein [Nitrobacter vulgaris]OPH82439.1 hypothetical protein B2M20_11610 [Nitrobacter vulgaris]
MADEDGANNGGKIGKSFNKHSKADIEKLPAREKTQYENNEITFRREQDRTKKENDLRRDERVIKEIQNQLGKPQPAPKPDFARTTASDDLFSPQKFKSLRDAAEKTVREREQNDLTERARRFEISQVRFLDRHLGKDRYPSKERE